MFNWFSRKKEVKKIKTGMKHGFDEVKKDINSISKWIKHLDSEKKLQQNEIEDIKVVLSSIQEEMEGIKNVVSVLGEVRGHSGVQTPRQVFKQQTAVYPVQTAVQTAVQTPNFDQFSITERAILWVLLNTDMKLGYDDLAAILGKEKATIRGQINTIKQKSEGLIEETIEQKGKKRVFIPEHIKEKLLKKSKVRVKSRKKAVKNVEKVEKK